MNGNLKSNECYVSQQMKQNKSIFNYMINTRMVINDNSNNTSPFLNYMYLPKQNVDRTVENDLLGLSRNNSRCPSCKYQVNNINHKCQ